MTCFYPMQAFKSGSKTKAGKDSIIFIANAASLKAANFVSSFRGNPSDLLVIPCGQCSGCRLERSRQWAVRCEKEIQHVEHNGGSSCFITLTFDDKHLLQRDNPMSLDKRDFQLFMKRLRKRFSDRVRFYHCGEYGELFRRPHYHAILFNCDFSDKVLWKVVNGQRLYTSKLLSELWSFGFSSIGSATFDSAAYVSRYIMKKHLGKDAWKFYVDSFDEETGELIGLRIPEYTTMSRRSGIGKEWLDKYLRDVYPSDGIFVRGKMMKCKPPRYYDSQYEILYPSDFADLKQKRLEAAKANSADNTPERLEVREQVLLSKIQFLKRNLE